MRDGASNSLAATFMMRTHNTYVILACVVETQAIERA